MDIFQALHDSEIRFGVASVPLDGFDVWLDDLENRRHTERVSTMDDVAEWLHSNVRKMYPASEYARRYDLISTSTGFKLITIQ